MRFIDEAIIEVAGGDGGHGCISYIRSKSRAKGVPNGGNGGRGGNVVIRGNNNLITLSDHSYLRYFRGDMGRHGRGGNKTGVDGKDKIIEVPLGTIVIELISGTILADIINHGQEFIAVKGGLGGKGNRHFISSTSRIPYLAQFGEVGEKKVLYLELMILADVGLIGLPNAGKSSLIRAITSARPKVSDYPFTTISPSLGVYEFKSSRLIVLADIPGLVAGAYKGRGLGLKFLKHIRRTRLLLYVVDISASDPWFNLQTVLTELALYDQSFLSKISLVALNKIDLLTNFQVLSEMKSKMGEIGLDGVSVSALTGQGINELMKIVAYRLERID